MSVQVSRLVLPALLLACALPISLDAQQPAQPQSLAAPPQASSVPTQAAPAPIAPAAPVAPVAPVVTAPVAPVAPPASPGAPPAPPAPAAPPGAAAAAGAAAGPPAAAEPPPTPAPAWLPRHSAELQIVEKVNATHRTLDVPVGGTAKFDTLAIAVKACLVRPPGQQRDAAAFLDISGRNAASPVFQGWMLAAEPAVSLFEDPLYDVRVTGCH